MTTLAFTRSGAGAPLVLLHGIGLSRHSWDPVIPALAGHFDVIAVDLPGFGDSEPLPPEVEPVWIFHDRYRYRSKKVRPDRTGRSTGMSHCSIF